MPFFAHKQLNTPKKSNKRWKKCENGTQLLLVLESRATRLYFILFHTFYFAYLFSLTWRIFIFKVLGGCAVFCLILFRIICLLFFHRLLVLFSSLFLILWLNFALSDESDSQSSFRLMSWHCQNRCLAISRSFARCARRVSSRWTRIYRYESTFLTNG